MYVKEIVMSPKQAVFVVMEFLEHDVKALLETITQPFLQVLHLNSGVISCISWCPFQAEVKTLMRQLLLGLEHLHSHWILHRWLLLDLIKPF